MFEKEASRPFAPSPASFYEASQTAPHRSSFSKGSQEPAQHCLAYLKNDKASVSRDNFDKINMNIKAVKNSQMLIESKSDWLTLPLMLTLGVLLILLISSWLATKS